MLLQKTPPSSGGTVSGATPAGSHSCSGDLLSPTLGKASPGQSRQSQSTFSDTEAWYCPASLCRASSSLATAAPNHGSARTRARSSSPSIVCAPRPSPKKLPWMLSQKPRPFSGGTVSSATPVGSHSCSGNLLSPRLGAASPGQSRQSQSTFSATEAWCGVAAAMCAGEWHR
jgi:hypothetical protein